MNDHHTCTSLDHCYPYFNNAPVVPGTKCYCGQRTWGTVPPKYGVLRIRRPKRKKKRVVLAR